VAGIIDYPAPGLHASGSARGVQLRFTTIFLQLQYMLLQLLNLFHHLALRWSIAAGKRIYQHRWPG